jgi:hypothetical protein
MLLAQTGHFDLRIRVAGLPLGPLLQLGHRLVASVFLDEEHGEPTLAGFVVGIPRQAEVVILLGGLQVCGPAEQLGLLMVRGPEVVEAVRIARLFRQRLLKMIDSPQIVPLLVELDASRVVVSGDASAAAGREADHE